MSRSSSVPLKVTPFALALKRRASRVTVQKSWYCPPAVRSQVYSNCLVRQRSVKPGLSGNDDAASANTGLGSKMGKASKSTACTLPGVPAKARKGREPASPAAVMPASCSRNCRGSMDMGITPDLYDLVISDPVRQGNIARTVSPRAYTGDERFVVKGPAHVGYSSEDHAARVRALEAARPRLSLRPHP